METEIPNEVITEPRLQLTKEEVKKLFTDAIQKSFFFTHKERKLVCSISRWDSNPTRQFIQLIELDEYQMHQKHAGYLPFFLANKKIHNDSITFNKFLFGKDLSYTVFFYAVRDVLILSHASQPLSVTETC
jgi:hypothetical protein